MNFVLPKLGRFIRHDYFGMSSYAVSNLLLHGRQKSLDVLVSIDKQSRYIYLDLCNIWRPYLSWFASYAVSKLVLQVETFMVIRCKEIYLS